MKETEKRKVYPMDIIFTLFSLVQLVHSVQKYMAEQAPMDFSNPMITGYAVLCVMAFMVAICILNKPDDERLNFFITQCLNFAVWWLTTLITYIIITVTPIGEIFGNACILTALFIVLALVELFIWAIISLALRNQL